jgi:Asp/Glu/hydantoin racemase
MIAKALKDLSSEADVIVLAQASMARVVDTLDEADKKIPILASPGIAIAHIATLLR